MIFRHRRAQPLQLIGSVGFGTGGLAVVSKGVFRWFSVIYGAAFCLTTWKCIGQALAWANQRVRLRWTPEFGKI
ncbi:MAG: hypothetical protein DA408_19105 [Bacteroidetes bacterium]|nr:MAG: hypothetical protein DA408_19105 [Bacteroidota bacterium]